MSESDIFNVVMQLAPTLTKYSELDPEYIKIQIENFNNGAQIKIISDKPEVAKALTEVLKLMGEISKANPKTDVQVIVK